MQYRKDPRIEIMKMIRANDLGRLLTRAGELHGHYCPGLAMGVMAGTYAIHKLGWKSEGLEKVLAIVETNGCFADGVQITTGCTFGNNSLIYRDIGKTALVVTRRDGNGLRLAAKSHSLDDPDYHQLFEKVIKKRRGTDEEKARFRRQSMKRAFLMLDKEISELFTLEKIAVKVPDYAPVHESITCDSCKEPVMSTRIIEKEGQSLCRTCAHVPFAELTGSGIGMNDI
jgi:formylmethanofuran dehydrogenase subunit E